MKILIDSNIIIYSLQSKHENLQKWLGIQTPVISAITQLEVLGYHRISEVEINFARRYFSICEKISINQNVIEEAVKLRQQKSMSIGDAIIAATAIIQNLPLASANLKDFNILNN
ncbi:PIN domain-containing protein [Flavobacteriaceae bacterium 14752]|uniref:PIN domain-containing protein n=1 Tax=Mesohalobacter salilacus TaxID=2491711 RepID=UPI000F640C0E|nr:PIN domain-containing protein [Flavobacteriaceae bacterium 14752]